TTGALLALGGASVAIASGTRGGFIAGVVLAHLAFWLDHVDGQVARWRGTSSLDGVYFDYLLHHAWNLGLGFALGQGLAFRSGDPTWSVAGFAIALGWLFLGLHNDCRYKAFFQRLKRETVEYRVEGGSGGRPSPPTPWPRRGRAALTWPAYKACEAHVVLAGLSAFALLALASEPAWECVMRGSVRGMAILAPTLAIARASRTISRRSVSSEFDAWFRPDLSTGDAATSVEDSEGGLEPTVAYHGTLPREPGLTRSS
ncbi:CDP-alcohol phosphatidyltransferase family protein, partial [Singulisphaera rosea]